MRTMTGRSYITAAALIGAALLGWSLWLAPAWSAQSAAPVNHVLGLLQVAILFAAVAVASISRPPTPPALVVAVDFRLQAAA